MLFAFYRINCCDVEPRANKNFSPVLSLSRESLLAHGHMTEDKQRQHVLFSKNGRRTSTSQVPSFAVWIQTQPTNLNNRAVSV